MSRLEAPGGFHPFPPLIDDLVRQHRFCPEWGLYSPKLYLAKRRARRRVRYAYAHSGAGDSTDFGWCGSGGDSPDRYRQNSRFCVAHAAAAACGPRERTLAAFVDLAPTRELAIQIGESLDTYGKHTGHHHTVIFGGVSQFHQVKAIRKGVDVLVATPGRLLDLMSQGHVTLRDVQFFVLDEMDRMLDMGFLPDIKRVLKEVPANRQTLFFSATMSPRIEQIASNMVKDPVRIAIAPDEPAVDRIEQSVLFVDPADKLKLLTEELAEIEGKAIVFLQMKHVANKVVDRLNKAGIEATAIHGNKSQAARVRALDGFRGDKFQVLVATDVAARGIDVEDVTLVINYDMPVESETYVHRIGRTARAGADGKAVSFCSPEDRSYLTAIEKLLGKEVPAVLDHPYHSSEAQFSKLKPRVPGQNRRGPHPKNRSRNSPSQRRDRRRRK